MPGKGKFARCVESVSGRGGVSDPRAVCAKSIAGKRGRTRGRVNAKGTRLTAKERALIGAGQKLALAKVVPVGLLLNKGKKKNPAGRTAEEAFRDFHGRDPEEIIDFDVPAGSKASMLPRKTSGIGDLIELDIRVPRDRHVSGAQYVKLANFGECWLTEHPRMKQLYVEGGDQSVDLEQFGLDESDPHEWEYLGELVRCVYFTRKDHLGKDGGEANYHHRFGKNELTLKKTELIKVAYHVPDEQLWFIGGGYEIPSEGIDG